MKEEEKEYVLMIIYPRIQSLMKSIEPFALDTIGNLDPSYRTVAVKAFNDVHCELELLQNRLRFLLNKKYE